MKILHLGGNDKFLPPFIDFVQQHFDVSEHEFLLASGMGKIPKKKNVRVFRITILQRLRFYFLAFIKIQGADKIILHGLFDPMLTILLYLNPWVLKKCYWCIWGGDLYDHQTKAKNTKWKIRNFLKRKIIPKIGHFITHIQGDYELAKKWYGAKGQWHDCFMYTSNLFKDQVITSKPHAGTNILLGNSATTSNNHLDAFEKLRPFAKDDIHIFCPLSYGDAVYAEQVEKAGKSIFGEKFITLRSFMPFEEYLQLLASVDIAIFNHDRQQGLGNITTLLGLGKTLYLQSQRSHAKAIAGWGLHFYDIGNFNKKTFSENFLQHNQRVIKEKFSLNCLQKSLARIFQGGSNGLS